MKAVALTFLGACLILGARPACAGAAGEFARSAPESRPTDALATRTVNDEVARLFGPGRVPQVSRLYSKYASRGLSKQCTETVHALQSRSVRREPAMATDALIAKAVNAGVNRRHVEKALATYLANRDAIPNQKFITVIDFNQRSDKKRMFVINLQTGKVNSYHVAHGDGSDPGRGRGIASRFSNNDGTHASSLGCALVAGEFRSPAKGWSMMVHGFEATNDNMCERAMWMHSAAYVGGNPGRSNGCPAVKERERREIFDQVGGGGLICSYKDGDYVEATRPGKKSKYKKHKKRRGSRVRGR